MLDNQLQQPETSRIGAPRQVIKEFEADYESMGRKWNLFLVIDAALKRPARVLYEVVNGRRMKTSLGLLAVMMICFAGVGLMMAGYSGGAQFGAVPLKIIAGTLFSAAICLPSLYILLCLAGGTQTFPQICSVLLQCLALAGILFVGFLPVAWVFSQATDSIMFMGFLYLLIWSVGLHFGLKLLRRSFVFLNKRSMKILHLWGFIFWMVLLQMSTTLRPLLGSYEPLNRTEKKFFIAHWIDVGDRASHQNYPEAQ